MRSHFETVTSQRPTSQPPSPSIARERVLDAAEALFMARGFRGTSLGDLAAQLGIQKASLYHHAPGGKAELYVAVMLRHFAVRREALLHTLASAPAAYPDRLHHVVSWLTLQPALSMGRLLGDDLAELGRARGDELRDALTYSVMLPLVDWVIGESRAGHLRTVNPFTTAGMLLAATESAGALAGDSPHFRLDQVAADISDLLLNGMRASSAP
jgi:TetR/AcrR family transcriptional regulator, cholesterol catabolism regulator